MSCSTSTGRNCHNIEIQDHQVLTLANFDGSVALRVVYTVLYVNVYGSNAHR